MLEEYDSGHRTLLATAIMAGGLRVSELVNLRWRDLDLDAGELHIPVSKTEAGIRVVHIEPELAELLRSHKAQARWHEPDNFIFPSHDRNKPRERNSVRTHCLANSVKRANDTLEAEGKTPIPDAIIFHSLRRTDAAIRAELSEHPALTTAQIAHIDPRRTLRGYTDVNGKQPQTRMAGLLASRTLVALQKAPL